MHIYIYIYWYVSVWVSTVRFMELGIDSEVHGAPPLWCCTCEVHGAPPLWSSTSMDQHILWPIVVMHHRTAPLVPSACLTLRAECSTVLQSVAVWLRCISEEKLQSSKHIDFVYFSGKLILFLTGDLNLARAGLSLGEASASGRLPSVKGQPKDP